MKYSLKYSAAKLTKFRKDLYWYTKYQFALPLEECEKINQLVEDFHAGYGITDFWDADFKAKDVFVSGFTSDMVEFMDRAEAIKPAFLSKFILSHFVDLWNKAPRVLKK